MTTLDKSAKNYVVPPSVEDDYITLDGIDFTDIAQAIDGSKSKPKDRGIPVKESKSNKAHSRIKRFWFFLTYIHQVRSEIKFGFNFYKAI